MPDTSIKGDLASGSRAVSITAATALSDRSRGVYVGVTQDLDFCFDGTNWVLFKACAAGAVYPLQVVGARKNSGSAAPDAGDVVFLY